MAQIDTSMYQNIRAPKINTPFENAAMLSQVQQGQAQNKLMQMKFAEAEREGAERNALSGAYRDYYAQPNQDPNMLYKSLAGAGHGAAIPGAMKSMNDAAAAGVELGNKRLTGQKMQAEITQAQRERSSSRLGALINDPNLSAEKVFADIQSQVQSGEATIEQAQAMAQRIPQDPAQLKPFLNQILMGVMKPKEQADLGSKERDFRQKTDEFAYRQQHDTATLAQQRETSLRTDSRTRDFNATKVEENTLKREAKADTVNLTKQSQLASFDTMIGTLDRIGKHPGLARSVGVTGAFPTMPGSDSANFQAELETFQSQAFIPMVSQLKGMGALSDAEGKKLTAAVGALNPKMGEKAFRESVGRITADMQAARDRVSGTPKQPTNPAPNVNLSSQESAELAALRKRFAK